MKPEPAKYIEPKNQKLTKKQLATKTYMHNGSVRLTIGDLTLDQLRVSLFNALRDQERVDAGINRALKTLTEILP